MTDKEKANLAIVVAEAKMQAIQKVKIEVQDAMQKLYDNAFKTYGDAVVEYAKLTN